MAQRDNRRNSVPPQVIEAARRDPGSTRAKPIDVDIDGLHFVADRRGVLWHSVGTIPAPAGATSLHPEVPHWSLRS